jgi:hypothetical protein
MMRTLARWQEIALRVIDAIPRFWLLERQCFRGDGLRCSQRGRHIEQAAGAVGGSGVEGFAFSGRVAVSVSPNPAALTFRLLYVATPALVVARQHVLAEPVSRR